MNTQDITVLYYENSTPSMELHSQMLNVVMHNDRAIIPDTFKQGKLILAVCEGNVRIMNKLGDRTEPFLKSHAVGV